MSHETNNDARTDVITTSIEGNLFPRLARYLAERTEIPLEIVAEIMVAAKVDTMRKAA